MPDVSDMELLRDYDRQGSEDAFAALVQRHIHLVYSVALRHVGIAAQAEEITQAVFIILARKAAGLRPGAILEGWLHETTRLTALSFLRGERRRHFREQEAYMQSTLQESAEASAWNQLSPLLDEAMSRLGKKDRDAVMLRFFKEKSLREVAAALNVNETAAQRRVHRAVEKLRRFFTKRGVALSSVAITAAISANSVEAAPAMLAKSVTAVAIAKGALASGSTLTLINGALKIMAWTKAKTAIITGAAVLLAAGTITVTVHEISKPKFNPNVFWATSYPTISGSPEVIRFMTNRFGHQLDSTFSSSTNVQLCSVSGLLNQCMEISGWQYLIDKNVAAGTVKFGPLKEMTGKEWVAAFENALQTGTPEWWDGKTKRLRKENLVLIRFPEQNTVLVLPKDKAVKYQ